MEAASEIQRRQAEFMRMQSQSFDILEEDIFVVDDNLSTTSSVSHRSRFRKSIAFFIGSDLLQKDDRDTKSEGGLQKRSSRKT